MALSAKKVGDPVDGLTDGKIYDVVGFTGSTVLVLDDNKKLAHVPYAAFNDSEQWSIDDGTAANETPKPAPSVTAAAASVASSSGATSGVADAGTASGTAQQDSGAQVAANGDPEV